MQMYKTMYKTYVELQTKLLLKFQMFLFFLNLYLIFLCFNPSIFFFKFLILKGN